MSISVHNDDADVTPGLVRWARERLSLPVEEAAKKLSIKPTTWQAWEAGRAQPSMSQAQTLAAKFYIPVGYLWLTHPPRQEFPLPDFRTVSNEGLERPSPQLFDLVSDILDKQDWYREFLVHEGVDPLPFIGQFSERLGPGEVAQHLRDIVGLSDELRSSASSVDEFLRLYINSVEQAGILVLRSGTVSGNTRRALDTREFRGFALSDAYAPFIFINGKDSKNAQVFTLTHEICHLLLSQSGLCIPDPQADPDRSLLDVERFCNRVAAEALVPRNDFETLWINSRDLEQNLSVLSSHFRVSKLVILRSALDQGRIDRDAYWSVRDSIASQIQKTERKSGGGNYYLTTISRNSRTFTATVAAAVSAGRLSPLDAAGLLNVSARSLGRITESVIGGS